MFVFSLSNLCVSCLLVCSFSFTEKLADIILHLCVCTVCDVCAVCCVCVCVYYRWWSSAQIWQKRLYDCENLPTKSFIRFYKKGLHVKIYCVLHSKHSSRYHSVHVCRSYCTLNKRITVVYYYYICYHHQWKVHVPGTPFFWGKKVFIYFEFELLKCVWIIDIYIKYPRGVHVHVYTWLP